MTRALPLAASPRSSFPPAADGQPAEDPVRPGAHRDRRARSAPPRATCTPASCARASRPTSPSASAARSPRASVDAGARVHAGPGARAARSRRTRSSARDAARAQLASAEADHALAKAELDRAADLLARKFISQSAFDARQAAYAAAKARVEQARSQAEISTNQEAYTTLAADADGVVVSVSAEPGQVVAAGQPVLRLARDGEMEVVLNAPESQVARFRPGQDVVIFLWADPANALPGTRARDRRRRRSRDADVHRARLRAARPAGRARRHERHRGVQRRRPTRASCVLPLTALVRDARVRVACGSSIRRPRA